jgi:hypothetical protein
LIALLGIARLSLKAADTLPAQYTDAEFWRMVTEFSEPGGDYQFENFVSNEISYQEVLPELSRLAKQGGVYFGVASEQNFTYIDVVRPKVAFIFDVRRQNTLQLLMYKALFEMADNRADYVSFLFSRKRPAGLDTNSTAVALFQAYAEVKPDAELYAATLKGIKDRLIRQHRFALSADDEKKLEYIFTFTVVARVWITDSPVRRLTLTFPVTTCWPSPMTVVEKTGCISIGKRATGTFERCSRRT